MLARIRKAMEEKDQGFTLIELLVVMIIIGILAAIAIPVFLNQRKNAVDASYKSDLRTVANEMESYYTDQEFYPDTMTEAAFGQPITLSNGAVAGSPTSAAIRVSKNTFVTLTLNANKDAYCLLVDNTKSKKGSHNWVYVSSQGGLQAASIVACPAAF